MYVSSQYQWQWQYYQISTESIPLSSRECFLFPEFCLWLNFVDACSSFWVVHLHYMRIFSSIVSLLLTRIDHLTLSWNSWINMALHFSSIPWFMWLVSTEFPQFMCLVSTEFPISLDNTFPSIQWVLNAYSQHEGETCGGIGK